jgi:hypothetical protein
MLSLTQLNEQHKSDKGTKHPYLQEYYEKRFSVLKESVKNLLEVGVWYGCSIKLWKDYFINANIVGVDWKNRKEHFDNFERIQLITGDSTKKETYNNLPNYFNIIIDDGDHKSGSQIKTFEILYTKLIKDGIYIIEDVYNLEEMKLYLESKKLPFKVFDFSKTHDKSSIIIEIPK